VRECDRAWPDASGYTYVGSTRRRKLAPVRTDKDAAAVPDDPQSRPEETVDALEERVLGGTADQSRDEAEDDSPAIEQDLDAEELGSSEASATEPTA